MQVEKGGQQDQSADSRNWIGRASGYADFDEPVERHATTAAVRARSRHEIDVSFTKTTSPYDPTASPAAGAIDDLVAASAFNVASHADEGSLARNIEATSRSRAALYPAIGTNCSDVAPASCSANGNRGTAEATSYRDAGDRSIMVTQLETPCATSMPISRNSCQLLGPVDVEDLAMYFDAPAIGRASHSRRSRYGPSAKGDQLRQDRRDCFDARAECDLSFYDPGAYDPRSGRAPQPVVATADDLRFCGPAKSGDSLGYYELGLGDPRLSRYPAPPDGLGACDSAGTLDPRLREPRPSDDGRFYDPRVRDSRPCEAGTVCQSGRDGWFCNDCPELFNFCSEERWLRCPASDHCPLYDTTYTPVAILPPCVHDESLRAVAGNDNWHYGYAEDEQLLEDYL